MQKHIKVGIISGAIGLILGAGVITYGQVVSKPVSISTNSIQQVQKLSASTANITSSVTESVDIGDVTRKIAIFQQTKALADEQCTSRDAAYDSKISDLQAQQDALIQAGVAPAQ